MKQKCVNGIPYINTTNATAMISGIRKAVLQNPEKTDKEIFEEAGLYVDSYNGETSEEQ